MSHVFIGFIAPSIILLPISVAIFNNARMPLALRPVFHYLVISGIINIAAIILSYRTINNLPLLHLLTLIELYFLGKFYASLFEGKTSAAIMYIFRGALLISLANSLWVQSIYRFNSYGRGITAISIILSSLLYFLLVADNKKTRSELCIVAGILLYYSGSFFLYLFSNFLKRGNISSTIIWNVNASLVIILYVLITIGILLCNRRQTTYIPFSS